MTWTVLPFGKIQLPESETDVQQSVLFVRQKREALPFPMSIQVTTLLFGKSLPFRRRPTSEITQVNQIANFTNDMHVTLR